MRWVLTRRPRDSGAYVWVHQQVDPLANRLTVDPEAKKGLHRKQKSRCRASKRNLGGIECLLDVCRVTGDLVDLVCICRSTGRYPNVTWCMRTGALRGVAAALGSRCACACVVRRLAESSVQKKKPPFMVPNLLHTRTKDKKKRQRTTEPLQKKEP